MEQRIPFSAMKERVNAKRRSVKVAMAALLLTVLGVGGVQAQCTFNASDFTVNASDGSDDMPYDDMVTLNYSGSEALDSIHFIITETTSGWTDSTNVTYDVDESRWFVQFSYLTAGEYTISLRPYCNGQASSLLSNGNTWSFTITCTPENASPVIDDVVFTPVCSGTTEVTISTSSTCGTADNLEFYIDDPDWENGADNYDGTYTNVTPGVHTFTVVNVNNSHSVDTTFTTAGVNCCGLVPADFTLTVEQSYKNSTILKCTYNGSGTWNNKWSLYVTDIASGETQSYMVSSSTQYTISSIDLGEYSWYVRPICAEGDTTESVIGDDFTVTCQHYPTYANFRFLNATDTYVLYCDALSTTGVYAITGRNTLSSNLGVGNTTVTYSIDRPDIATCNSQSGQLTFTGVPGDVVITATATAPGYCDTTASFTLTVIKPELSFNTITITPVCYVLEDENYGMDGNINISFDCQCTNNNLYRYIISPAPNTQIATEGSGYFSSEGILSFYGVHPDTYTITIYIEGTDISIDTTVVVPMKLSVSVQNDSSTVCSANPNLTLIANVSAAQGATYGTLSYSWEDADSNVLSTSQAYTITTGNTNPVLTVTESSNHCGVSYTPTINWIDGYGAITVDSVTTNPSCGDNGTITVYVSSECGDPDWEFSLSTGETNSDGEFVSLYPGDYAVTISEPSTGYDTTITVTVGEDYTCPATLAGSSELSISGFSYEDYDNTGNFGDFYYVVNIPTINGDYVAVEAQYYKIGTTDTNSTYLDMGTGRSTLNIPINAKGDWVVRMRARCCGYNPGDIAGDWLLTDTIHHYPNFEVQSVTGVCNGNDGYATVRFIAPRSASNMGVRIYPANDPSDITFSSSSVTGGTGTMYELMNLAAGEYKMYVYVTDGTDENTYNAYLDTTFTIGTRVQLSIENDNARVCENTTDTLRANVSGGTQPYTYQWYYDGDYPDLGDGSNLLAIPNGPSNYVTCIVTDNNNCQAETYIEWEVLPAYTQETQDIYDDYSYDEPAGAFHVPQNLCPLNRFGITYDCSESGPTMDANLQSVDGCDSIKQIHLSTQNAIGIPGGGTLDTTISYSDYLELIDDGGGDGFYSLNSHGKAIIRAAGGGRDKLIVSVYNSGALSDEDTLRIYKEESEMAVGYNREGTWNLPGSDTKFMVSSGVTTVNFYTGSKRGFIDDAVGYWKGYRMEHVSISVKSPDQLAVTPICGGSGSVQVTNPTGGVYYCLTNPGGTTDTVFYGGGGEDLIFSNLTEAGSYTLRSYVKIDGNYQTTDHDTTFTIPAGSFELSVEGDSTTVCSVNPSVTLTANVTGGEAPYAYSWSDGSSNATTTVSEAYATPTVTVTDNSGCAITYVPTINWVDYIEGDDIDEATICESESSYTWNGNTITTSDEYLEGGIYVYRDTVTGNNCPTVRELHLTVKPNATVEEHVVAWGTSYTWPVDGNSYTTSLGGYSDTVNGCPVTVEYGNDAATATHSGVADNGCDSIYTLNLTLIDGIPIPVTGTTDTTLATMVEGDTLWVYDESGMRGSYSLEQNGLLILRAPEGYTLQVVAQEFNAGDGDRVNLYATERDAQYYTYDYFDNNGGMSHYDYFHNNGTPSGRPYVSVSRDLYMKFAISDSVVVKGFKLAVTLKSLDDTCLAVYDVEASEGANMYEKVITWRHEGSAEGYHVFIGCSNDDVYFDTIVTDTFFIANHEWISPAGYYNFLELWAVCGDGDTSYVDSQSLSDQCGFRPGLADGETYHAPATFNWSEPSNNDFNQYGDMPPCWSREASSYTRPDTNLTYPMLDDVFGGDANWSALYFYTNADVDQFAAMPKFDTTYGAMNKWALNFTLELADYSHTTECDAEPVVMYVGVMTDPTLPGSFTVVDSVMVNSNDYTEEYGNSYYVSLAGYQGSGLYPAFKMARREMHNPNDYANPTLMLYDVMVVPEGGLKAPTNITIADHPTQEGKAIISWTAPAWPQYDDDYSTGYELELTKSSGSTFTVTADYDATSITFDATAGEQYKLKLYYKVNSARYSTSWRVTDGMTYKYERPLYDHMTADTIGDLSDERLYSYRMPFEYGSALSTEILVKSDEIDATAIDAIAFRMAPESCIPGTSFQNVKIYMKDVTLTELDAQNMTDDYLFNESNVVRSDTTTTGGTDGWLTFPLDQTYTHNPDMNILIGVASSAGDYADYYGTYTKFYVEADGDDRLALSFEGASDLTSMPASHDQYYRPQMKLIGKNNCTNDTLVIDTNLCENASLDWRGQTISFSDPDIESHMVQISTYNYIYVYTDKVEEVTASGCDSIYKLQITKRYNEDNNYDIENSSYPHETSCGPYTWRNGVTYDYNMGTYQYDDGGCPAYGFYGPRAMDTVRGVATYGCDSIYGLNLEITPYFTIIFDTTGVVDSTAMATQYICDDSYALPACTMVKNHYAFTAWLYEGDTLFVGVDDPIEANTGDTILLTPIWELDCTGNDSVTHNESICPTGGSITWHGHTVDFNYVLTHGFETSMDQTPFYSVYDTVPLAIDGLCDSIYVLSVRMENKLVTTYDLLNDGVCPAGYTWIDGHTYTTDTGYNVYFDDDDNYEYYLPDFTTAPYIIDSTANNGCGTYKALSVRIDSTLDVVTLYFIKNYIEGATSLDTLYTMTMNVCDGSTFTVPDMPDTVTREGYDFEYWSDNPACGWTVTPGTTQNVSSDWAVFYGMWESNCSNDTIYDTTTVCVNDTVEWHGFTWRGAELEFGTWDTTMTKYGVIPGECDSVFMLTITVPSIPMLSVTGREDPLCYGDQNGWISVAVDDGNAPFQYALGDSNYTAALDTTGHKFENLAAGSHTVWVKDACGVTDMAQVEISTPNLLTVNVSSYTDSAVCYEAGKQLNAEVSGGTGIYTYMWNNDTNRTNDTLMVNTSIAGTRTDTVLVTDGNGCTAIGSYTTIVYDTMTVTVNGGDTTYCFGATAVPLTVTVTGGDTNSGFSYTWYDYNQQTVQGESITVPTNVAATYSQMGVTINNTCGTKQLTVPAITVLDHLEVNAEDFSDIYCLNSDADTISLEGQIIGSGNYSYQWYAVTGTVTEIIDTLSNATEIWYVPATNVAGETEYRVKVTDLNCGFDTIVSVGTISVMDSIRITSSIDSLYTCPGSETEPFSVTYEGDGEIDYDWYLNGTEVYREMVNEFMPSQNNPGTYNYYLVLRSGYGCASDSVLAGVLTVYDTMVVTSASDSISYYCPGVVADPLRVNIIGGSGRYGYTWSNPSGDILGTDSTYTPVTTGDYDSIITVLVFDSICGDEQEIIVSRIRLYEAMTASLSTESFGAVCIHSEVDTIFVQTEGGSGSYTYQWLIKRDPGSDIIDTIEGATESFYHPTTDTASIGDNFYVMVSDINGCGDTTIGPAYMYVTDSVKIRTSYFESIDSTYCLGDTASTIPLFYDGGAGNSYTYWYVNGVATSDTALIDNLSYTPTIETPGTYNISVSMSMTVCGSDSVHVTTITVGEDYIAYFTTGDDSLQSVNTPMDSIVVCSIDPSLVLPENEYVYDLHEFIGWYNQATGDTVQPGDTVLMTESLTFNTVWRALCSNVDTVSYATICDGDTITWRGYTVTSAQAEYADTVAGVVDVLCDSVYHLLLTVNYPTTSDTTMLACDSVWWNSMFFTETPDTTQSYFMAGGNQYGCDSTAYLNLTVNYSIHDYVVETACDSYTFDNVTYTESTDLPTVGAISDNGCPFITHISLTMNYSYHGEDSATACDMYVWNDMELTETGDHDYTGVTVDGCDSVVTLHLTLHQTAYGMDTQTACDSLVWIDGNTYFGDFPGNVGEITYTFEGGSMYGCDSVAVLDLTMEDHIYVEFLSDFGDGWMDEVAACVMKPLVMPECAFENAGFVFSGWLNTVGNDTVYPGDTLYLEESRSYYAIWNPLCEDVITFTDTAVCEGASLVWRGQNFSDQLFSGDYEDVVYNAIEDWCDSVFYLRLTVYPVSYNEFFDSVVGSVIWYDEEYSTSGDYSRFCGYNRYGCDSTEVLHLIVNLAIDEKEDGVIDVKVYPNPTSGIVNIDGVEIRRIAVLDQVGRTVATFDDTNRIDISDLPAGIYTLYVQTSAGDTTRRVMKR
jgi:hypothetical protein